MMTAKARMFLVPDASVCLTRDAPISYIRKPTWMRIITATVQK